MNNVKQFHVNCLTVYVKLVVFYPYFKEDRIHLEASNSTNRLM